MREFHYAVRVVMVVAIGHQLWLGELWPAAFLCAFLLLVVSNYEADRERPTGGTE